MLTDRASSCQSNWHEDGLGMARKMNRGMFTVKFTVKFLLMHLLGGWW
jgi:hypothetical protein